MLIEKDVPLPKASVASLAEKMEPGDSVLCESRSLANSLSKALHTLGKKTTSAAEGAPKVRVWCVK